MSCDPRPHKQPIGGFTLIEVTVVLAVLALAYGLALPVFSRNFDGPRLNRTAREIVSALREARSTALLRGRPVFFRFRADDGSWQFDEKNGRVDSPIRLNVSVPAAWRRAGGVAVIGFYPDGGTSGAQIGLVLNDRSRRIRIHWLTGRVTQTTP